MSSDGWTPSLLAAKASEVRTSCERGGDRRIAGLSLVALLSLAPAVARAGQPVGPPLGQGGQPSQSPLQGQPRQGKGDEVTQKCFAISRCWTTRTTRATRRLASA